MGEKERALADVVGARRGLDRARAKGAVAQARFEAAIVRAASRGLSQRELAVGASVSQPYVSQLVASHSGRFVPRSRLGYVLAAHRRQLLEIVRRYGAHNVKVFGSVARGDDGPSSDIDLLVDIPDDMGLFTLARMELDVQDLLGESVDLVPSRMLKSGVRQSADLDAAPL